MHRRSPICAPAQSKRGGIFDFDAKASRLNEVNRTLEDPKVWDDAKRAQDLGREKKSLEDVVATLTKLDTDLIDAGDLFQMAKDEGDDETLGSIESDADALKKIVEGMEFRRMFANEADAFNCFLDIQSGSGGTEAQDWASDAGTPCT